MPALLIRISIAREFCSIASTPSLAACAFVTSKPATDTLCPAAARFRRGRIKLAGVAAVQDDFGTVFGKALREREAYTLRRPGDERSLASQVERFKCHVTIPCCLKPQGLIAQATS
jgi:hypothetical protein